MQQTYAKAQKNSVSTTALYNKLCGVELNVSEAQGSRNSRRLKRVSKIIRWRAEKYTTRL